MRWLFMSLFVLLTALPARSTELELVHIGTLTDLQGEGLNGVTALTVRLYDANGAEVWERRFETVPVIRGHYEVTLGTDDSERTVESALLGGHAAETVGISVGDDPELTPRSPLTSVPIAARTRGARVAEGILDDACPGDGALVFDSAEQMLAVCADGAWSPIPFDYEPDPFGFPTTAGQDLSSLVTSSAVTPTGYVGPMPVSVSGQGSPQLSIAGGPWDTTGSIEPGQTVQLRATTSATYGVSHTVTLNAGQTPATWSLETKVQCPASCSPSGSNRCVCSGVGSGACPAGSEWDCGVYASWTAGTAQRCLIPSGWSYISGSRQAYRHGSTPQCSFTLQGNQSFSFVLERN